jgi:hypothetical protein
MVRNARLVSTEYQYIEACEIARRETGDARFDARILRWAKQHQQLQPTHAWGYALEAAYSTVATDVTRALAMTLYLDPQSPRIKKFDAKRIAVARAWLKANNPFLQEERAKQQRGVQAIKPPVAPVS